MLDSESRALQPVVQSVGGQVQRDGPALATLQFLGMADNLNPVAVNTANAVHETVLVAHRREAGTIGQAGLGSHVGILTRFVGHSRVGNSELLRVAAGHIAEAEVRAGSLQAVRSKVGRILERVVVGLV